GKPWNILGARLGPAWILTSLIFAFSHSLMTLQWWHFAIFFPGLAFGWLREKTGYLSAGILFHALSNTYAQWIFLNYQ
ncbi:MAG: CPBP family intramembrane metalloprotease, partial [Deltaproteobacteria bacterium]|nr:CPBP family intramembrane metalloprotease [Deltaproteobacteria bacterium]